MTPIYMFANTQNILILSLIMGRFLLHPSDLVFVEERLSPSCLKQANLGDAAMSLILTELIGAVWQIWEPTIGRLRLRVL